MSAAWNLTAGKQKNLRFRPTPKQNQNHPKNQAVSDKAIEISALGVSVAC